MGRKQTPRLETGPEGSYIFYRGHGTEFCFSSIQQDFQEVLDKCNRAGASCQYHPERISIWK